MKVAMALMSNDLQSSDEPILTQLKREKQMADQGDGSLPIKASWKKVLEEDEKQLDLLQGKRSHIFQTARPSAQKDLLPPMKQTRGAMLSPQTHKKDYKVIEAAPVTSPQPKAPPYKLIHQKARIQQQYNRMKQVLREREKHEQREAASRGTANNNKVPKINPELSKGAEMDDSEENGDLRTSLSPGSSAFGRSIKGEGNRDSSIMMVE